MEKQARFALIGCGRIAVNYLDAIKNAPSAKLVAVCDIVEEKAKNELGMVKKDQVPKYYLTIRNEDKIEIVEEKAVEKTGVIDKIVDFGKNIADRVKAFFGR